MSERFKEPVLKTGDGATHRGFESHSLRQETGTTLRVVPVSWRKGDSKGRPDRRSGKKVSGGHFFRPWENPCASGRIPEGCGQMRITGTVNVGSNSIWLTDGNIDFP